MNNFYRLGVLCLIFFLWGLVVMCFKGKFIINLKCVSVSVLGSKMIFVG